MHFVPVKTKEQQDIQAIHRIRQRLVAQRTAKVEGIGPMTATAMVVAVGDGKYFKNGRQLAAWRGLAPGQYSSGDRRRRLSITKRGDRYLRTLLIHGARAVVGRSEGKSDGRGLGQ